jgi:hypothetical protein
MLLKNPVTPPGIDPRTVRLLAHYATPGPKWNKSRNKTQIIHVRDFALNGIPEEMEPKLLNAEFIPRPKSTK